MEKYNVILIGIDTLRADHLGCYGYDKPTSPNIDELARRGTLYKNCFSQAPITAPSFMSIMTSRYPSYHGVTANIGGESMRGKMCIADPTIPTIAEILKSRGYKTAAFTDGGNLYPDLGFSRGFDYYSINRGFGKKKALIPEQDILYWLESERNNPFFLFFHTYAVHSPWSIPQQYQNTFLTGEKPHFLTDLDRTETQNFADMYIRELKEYLSLIRTITEKKGGGAITHLEDLYDGAIFYVDNFVGRILNSLEGLKLSDKTIVVFVADHGEEFLEHGMLSHIQMYNELLHVPLVIKIPGQNGPEIISSNVRNIDIFPTIFDILNIKLKHAIHGISLRHGAKEFSEKIAIAECPHENRSIRTQSYKYIFHIKSPFHKHKWGGMDELYDLTNDPLEKNNIAPKDTQKTLEMIDKLQKELHGRGVPIPTKKSAYLLSP